MWLQFWKKNNKKVHSHSVLRSNCKSFAPFPLPSSLGLYCTVWFCLETLGTTIFVASCDWFCSGSDSNFGRTAAQLFAVFMLLPTDVGHVSLLSWSALRWWGTPWMGRIDSLSCIVPRPLTGLVDFLKPFGSWHDGRGFFRIAYLQPWKVQYNHGMISETLSRYWEHWQNM